MKRMTDKDLRLYKGLSDIDSDLILDSTIPASPVPIRTQGRRMDTLRRVFSNPMVASLAVSTVIITLLMAVLLATGAFRRVAENPPAHNTETPASTHTEMVPHGDAAMLRKGMSLAEVMDILGANCWVFGEHASITFTFTLETGEQLAVETVGENSDPENYAGRTVQGFTWLGDTAKEVNPMAIPSDVLHKLQEYAMDTVVPVYTMNSLLAKYNERELPGIDEVLKDADMQYLRIGADGEITLLDEEGHSPGGNPQAEVYRFLDKVSAFFDESVRVKAYYPILTSMAMEQGAVYFCTSIGDYILYLHREGLPFIPEGAEVAYAEPYLMPVIEFHKFAYGLVDKSAMLGIGWDFTEERMAAIEPYRMDAEGYRKPVNLATPEAVAEVKTDMEHSAVEALLGTCLRCAAENTFSLSSYARTSIVLPTYYKEEGLHYWELTDGTCLAIHCIRVSDSSQSWDSGRFLVSDIMRLDAPEQAEAFGTPSLANYGLLAEGMSQRFVRVIMGENLDTSDHATTYADWGWMENGKTHTLTVTWNTEDWADIAPNATRSCAASFAYASRDVSQAAEEIALGMSYRSIMARLGYCLCGHTADDWTSGYHFWTLPDGRCLAAYMGVKAVVYDNPVPRDRRIALHLLWLDSASDSQTVGTPSLSRADVVEHGMEERVVTALMGEPGHTEASLVSAWTWEEKGKTYTFTVYWNDNQSVGLYWNDNQSVGLYSNFRTVAHCELTETSYPSISFPEKEPTVTDAAAVTVGMSTLELLRIMGSGKTTLFGDAALYCWYVDNRVFCALAEPDVSDPVRGDRVVTYTFYRDSMEDISTPTPENMEAITEGMSMAAVAALLGQPNISDGLINSPIKEWITPEGTWWEIKVEFETVTHPETGKERAYVASVTLIKS